jgi:hypothetical protein
MRKWLWEMLARLLILTFDVSFFKMAETLNKYYTTVYYSLSPRFLQYTLLDIKREKG